MKMERYLVWGVVGVALIALVGNVQGSVRPWGNDLSELQGVFTDIYSTIDAVTDQTTEDLFLPTGATPTMAYVATVSWTETAEIEFGIYNMDDPEQKLSVFFQTVNTSGDSVALYFDEGDNSIEVWSKGTFIDETTYFREFGFYAISVTGTFYSEDNLNPGDYAHLLTYEGNGDNVTFGDRGNFPDDNHWYIATECGMATADTSLGDFTDLVVQMESITPIPEPASMAMIGLVVGSGLFIRRKFMV